MEAKKQDQAVEIDLVKLFGAYLRRWWLIVICGVLIAAGTWFFSTRFITPMYRAGVTIYVNNSSSGERIESISSGQMSASQQLVRTYVNIINSNTVLEAVIQAAQLNCTAEELRKMMSTEQLTNTEMFKVYILHPEPEKAAFIVNAIADVAPGAIEEFVEGSSTKIIDYAKVPKAPFTPNVRRNTLVGGVIGVVLALVYLTIYFLLDVRIKEESDLTSIAEYPVLGHIPDFTQLGSHSGRYGYRYGYSKKPDSKRKEENT
jgi:capsular polysaccharide biosynthesis protein